MARYFCGQEHRTYVDNLIVRTSAQLTDKNVPSFTITTMREAKLMTAIQTYIDAFERDGYVIVPDVSIPDRAAAALRDMENLFYGMSFDEYLAKSEKEGENAPLESAYGHQFPCGKDSLDCLIENDYFLDLMEALLGADQIRFRFGGLFLRSGPTDTVPGGFRYRTLPGRAIIPTIIQPAICRIHRIHILTAI